MEIIETYIFISKKNTRKIGKTQTPIFLDKGEKSIKVKYKEDEAKWESYATLYIENDDI